MNAPLLVVLDLETTGLAPRPYRRDLGDGRHAAEGGDNILEIGAIAVAPWLAPNTPDTAVFHALVRRTKPMAEIDPFVIGMHTKNGLWADLGGPDGFGGLDAADADRKLATWLRSHGAVAGDGQGANASGNVVLVGYSVHFDHSFLKAQFPETARLLSHRVRDVGAFAMQCVEWNLPVPGKAPSMPHRALQDAEIELKQYLGLRDALQALHRSADLNPGTGRPWGLPGELQWPVDANGAPAHYGSEAPHDRAEPSGVRPLPR